MKNKNLPLEKRLSLAVSEFARDKDLVYKFDYYPKEKETVPTKLMFHLSKKNKVEVFTAVVDIDKDQKIASQVYNVLGYNNPLYEEFCKYLDLKNIPRCY